MKQQTARPHDHCAPRSPHYIVLVSILALLAILPTVDAKYTSAKLNVTMEWTVQSDSILDQGMIEVFIPSNSSNQKVTAMRFSDPYELLAKDNGSIWKARFNVTGIRAKRITGNFLIETDYINRTKMDDSDNAYLNVSKNVVINKEIRDLAATFNQTFPDNVIKMNEWVYGNIKYNLNYTGVTVKDITQVTQPSDWVLQNRVGVCDELSTLFVALARAKGIPARIVVGQVFRDGQWIPHAWAEVYIPKYGWIETDPTWNEFLNLNALRFRTGTGADSSDIIDRINATTKKAAPIEFGSNTMIEIVNASEGDGLSIDLRFPPQFPTAETQPVMLKAKNRASSPIYATASLIPPIGVECTGCKSQIFLDPDEEATSEFSMQLPTLSQNVRYKFPVMVVTDYGRKNASFERLIISESPEERYKTVADLPLNFKWFIGLFMIAAVSLVIIVILAKV